MTMLPFSKMIRVTWSKNTSVMNSAWKIGVNSHARSSIGFAPGEAGVSGAWLGIGEPWGRRWRRFAPGDARRDEQRDADEQEDRRQPSEQRREARHAVFSSV